MAVDGKTALYGIMGKPVSHSLSPAMHNAAFAALVLNNVYLPFAVDDAGAALDAFRVLGVRGVSVTIPYKESVIPHLDSIDSVAEKIGAVNTLLIQDGHVHGCNTDWIGANRALSEKLELKGRTVLLLGAGGSARAIGFGLLEAGAAVVLASRTPERGKALAALLGCPWLPLAEAGTVSADALVNATSVGMEPESARSPVDQEVVSRIPVVMDIVYSPLETKLLRMAAQAGCTTVDGLAMLLYQGVAQFEMWTGREAPVSVMRDALLSGISNRNK